VPTFFYHLIADGSCQGDAVQNSFWYRETDAILTEPDAAFMETTKNSWVTQVEPDLLAVMPNDYVLRNIVVVPYKSDGTLGSAFPAITPRNTAGVVGAVHDGTGVCAILAYVMGSLLTLTSDAGLLRRSYNAVGPIPRESINEAGVFDPGFFTSGQWAGLRAALVEVLEVATVPKITPVRVSHLKNHVVVPSIASYRDALTTVTRPDASFRRSRMNHR